MSHTPAASELSRRVVACPRWRWMPGMRMIDAANGFNPCRVVLPSEGVRVTTLTHRLYRPTGGAQDAPSWPNWVPDLDDPATAGCLLALVREAHGRSDLHACPMFSLHTGQLIRWRVAIDEHMAHYGPTEAAALVAALESAP